MSGDERFFLRADFPQRLKRHSSLTGKTTNPDKLLQLENTQDLVIREISIRALREDWGHRLAEYMELPSTAKELETLSIHLFNELENK